MFKRLTLILRLGITEALIRKMEVVKRKRRKINRKKANTEFCSYKERYLYLPIICVLQLPSNFRQFHSITNLLILRNNVKKLNVKIGQFNMTAKGIFEFRFCRFLIKLPL